MTKRQSETEPAAKFVAKVDGFLGAAQRLHNYLARVGQSPSLAETAFSLAPSAKSSLFETFPLEYKQWDLDHFPRRKMPHSYAPEFVAIVMDQVRNGRPLAQVARSAGRSTPRLTARLGATGTPGPRRPACSSS